MQCFSEAIRKRMSAVEAGMRALDDLHAFSNTDTPPREPAVDAVCRGQASLFEGMMCKAMRRQGLAKKKSMDSAYKEMVKVFQ
eukprot:4739472-Lingulodinium_polyedra.AAC.1